jgi:hypothetical protein
MLGYQRSVCPVACQWSVVFSGYSVSSTTKTCRHDIAEVLLKVALITKNQINLRFFNTYEGFSPLSSIIL